MNAREQNSQSPNRLNIPSNKSDSVEYRVADSLLGLKDCSKKPLVNDRQLKLGSWQGTFGAYIIDFKEDRFLRNVADGILDGDYSSIFPFEFDSFILRDHRTKTTANDKIHDIVHAVRMICDRERATPANRSTVVIDQSGLQRQSDLNSIFHVILAPGSETWQKQYNGAGEFKKIYG